MKKTLLLFAVFVLAACNNNQLDPPINIEDEVIITLAAPPETKVSFSQVPGALHPSWELDDRIIGFTGTGAKFCYSVESVDASTGAATLRKISGDALDVGDKLFAVYCPGYSVGDIEAGTIKVDFSFQKADEIPSLMLAGAVVPDSRTVMLHFSNAVALIGIESPVLAESREGRTIDKAVVSGHGVVCSGVVSVVNDELCFTADAPSKFIEKELKDVRVNASMSIDSPIYIAVPPCSVEKVSLVDSDTRLYCYTPAGDDAQNSKFYHIKSKAFSLSDQPVATDVIINGVNWSAYNLGATMAASDGRSAGDLYRWADTGVIYTAKSTTYNNSATITFDGAHQSGYVNYPGEIYAISSSAYSKYNETDGKTVLDPVDDIVQLKYPGTGWRMPTYENWVALSSAMQDGEHFTVTGSSSTYGVSITDNNSGFIIFLPRKIISGKAGTDVSNVAYFWTSTVNSGAAKNNWTHAHVIKMSNSGFNSTYVLSRDIGVSVRPVKDAVDLNDIEYEVKDVTYPERPVHNVGKSVAGLPGWKDISIDYSNLTESDHPRLFLFEKDFNEIRKALNNGNNPYLSKLNGKVLTYASKEASSTETLQYTLDASGTRLLHVSRRALHRIIDMAYAYKMTGLSRFLDAAEANINAVCDFPDWHPSHFLDVGEMAFGVAVGYDWLFDDLTDATRLKAAAKLKEYALDVASNAYNKSGNWNQVCNAGVICAALATYENNPSLSDEVVRKALCSNARQVYEIYSPEGAFPEGPGYWEYGTTYQAVLNLALESALGTDFEITTIDGFPTTGDYYIFERGNSGKRFNYSDSGETDAASVGLWYIAYKMNNPSYLYQDLYALEDGSYVDEDYNIIPVICAYKMGGVTATPPSGRMYLAAGSKNPLFICRTGWGKNDLYLAAKGGKASLGHAHMDAGEVVFDAYGTRWFKDFTYSTSYTEQENMCAALGISNFGNTDGSYRWMLLQHNNRSHSTITVNDKDHLCDGFATLTGKYETESLLGGRINLTPVFGDDLASAVRTAVIKDSEYLRITDVLEAPAGVPAHIRWTCATDGVPIVLADRIELSDGKTTMVLAASGTEVVYKTWSTNPQDYGTLTSPYEKPLDGYLCGFEFDIPAGATVTLETTLRKQ